MGASDVPQSVLPPLDEKKTHHPILWFLVVVLFLGIAGYAAWEISDDFRGAVINLKNKFIPAQDPVKSVQQPEGSVGRDEASPVIPSQAMENATKPAETKELQYKADAIIYKMCEAKGNLYAVMKEILRRMYGLELGSVRRPLPSLAPEDEAVVAEAQKMIEDAIGAL